MKRKRHFILELIIIIVAMVCIFPIIITVLHSFMGIQELRNTYPYFFNDANTASNFRFHLIPYKITLSGYYEVLIEKIEFAKIYAQTLILVVSIVIGQTVLSILAAFTLIHLRVRFKKMIIAILVFLALMPFQVTVVPQYISLKTLNLLDTYKGLWCIGTFSAFGTLLILPFMKKVKFSTIEAARLDGASDMRTLVSIVCPQIRTGVGLLMIFLFIDYWNMIEQPMVFIREQLNQPMSVFLNYIAQTDFEAFFPGAILYIIPVLLVFIGLISLVTDEINRMDKKGGENNGL